jgi:outer membrane protein insertion porin family
MKKTGLGFLLAALLSTVARADFTVTDIRVEGLQRIPEGTVFNLLPVNIGTRSERNARGRAPCSRAGSSATSSCGAGTGVLVVVVQEFPSIRSSTSPATRPARRKTWKIAAQRRPG